jgi:esterase/lipase superfamily enzyme
MPIPVYFATSRNQIAGPVPNNFGTDFNPDGGVIFGKSVVGRVDDESEIGNSNLSIDRLSTVTFWQDLQDEVVEGGIDHLLVYLHGFDYRFREAVMRSAALVDWFGKARTPVASRVLMFSWPSLGSLSIDAYRADYANAGLSGAGFKAWLDAILPILARFRAAAPARRVTLMAHSMGNHCLAAGLETAFGPGVAAPAGGPLFDRVFLIAADEDSDALRRPEKLARILELGERVYVYYSNQDVALGDLSRLIHRRGRLGIDGAADRPSFAGTNCVFVNCSTCNVDLGNGRWLDWQWHQYYHLIPEVRDDIAGVMLGTDDGALPNRRYNQPRNFYRLDLAPSS